jgi:hypothetical protein
LHLEYSTNLSGVDLGLVDVVCKLMHARNLNNLLEVNFREVDSFLRDENHIPCFDSPPNSFSSIKSLFIELYWLMLMPPVQRSVEQLVSYVEKLNAISEYVNKQWNENSLVKMHKYDAKFIALEGNLIILEFKKSTEEKTKQLLCEKLCNTFCKILDEKSIKVVAEL